MNINHVQWENDILVFYFFTKKGDQSEDKSGDLWHVYSNLKNPELCPVLVLEMYLLSHPDLLNGNCPLFPRNNQYERFMKIFHRVIHENKETFHILGVEEHLLGSNWGQKGKITLCLSGCTVSPSMAYICLRSCWSMSPVKDRYIHYKKAGDQFTGRPVTAISSLKK